MGAADERLQGTGRGDCENRIDIRLSEEVRAENCSDFSYIFQSCGRIVHKFYGIIYANKENGKLESNKRMWLYEKSILVFWAIVCLLPIQRRFKNFK